MKEGYTGIKYDIGGDQQESAKKASEAESDWAKNSDRAEKTARENEAREKVIKAFDTFQGEAQRIPLDDITIYSEPAKTYVDAIDDPNNNLTEKGNKKIVQFARDIIKEAEIISKRSEKVAA